MKQTVVSNTSTLIFLAKLDAYNLAKNRFPEILVPKQVLEEIFVKPTPEINIIKDNLTTFLQEIEVKNIKDLPLGDGERSAISYCLQNKYKLFLSDDKKARRIARSLGLETVGILGILLWNLENKKINKIKFMNLFNNLIKKKYYISSDLYSRIMELIKNI
tara:strand:- start:1387 stop:1869 length:483 start_codon:yes stop_codon:yes gene_type:complete